MADDARTDDASRDASDSGDVHTRDADALRNVRGAMYLPQKDWNAYQTWADYRNPVVERNLGYAATLGLNSLRVLASYEAWREDGPTFFAHVEHFLTTCDRHGIRPVVVLFEAPPKSPPTPENLHATDPNRAFGVHSPSRPAVLQPRNWKGYARSPIHFARRWGQEYAGDDRVLATEIMNEPGKVQPRRDFVLDALREVRDAAPTATLTMGTKDVWFARFYDRDDELDVYQFHMNLPRNPAAARDYMTRQRAYADELADDLGVPRKPVWCTEWQRTLEEPPSRFAPNLASLAPTIRRAHSSGALDGDFFWSLMLRPAYLRDPRRKGRVNGLFHADGAVYSRLDAEVVAGRPLDLRGRHALPASWTTHQFPYPGTFADVPAESADLGRGDDAANPRQGDDAALKDGYERRGSTGGVKAGKNPESTSGSIDVEDLPASLLDRLARLLGFDAGDGRRRDP